MKKYQIEIKETVSQVFEVYASSEEEALKTAEDHYKEEKFVLEPGNLLAVEFSLIPDE